MMIESVQAKCGCVSAKVNNGTKDFYLHSSYDPLKEAAKLVASYNIIPGSTIVVYGVGLGYHVREMLNRTGPEGRVILFQLGVDIFRKITGIVNLADILNDSRVTTIITDDKGKLTEELALHITEIIDSRGQLIIHRPSLDLLPATAIEIKQALEEWEITKATQQRFLPLLQENLKSNMSYCQGIPRIEELFGRFTSIPIVLVAGGPSLDDELENLRYFAKRNKGLIIAVGTSLKPLIEKGITPHLAIITDPQPIVKEQIRGLKLHVPLIILPTVHPVVIESYAGLKILACQKGLDSINELCSDDSILVETGGSVTTTMLDIALKMGGDPLVFIGVDLAYPGGKTHASNTMYQQIIGDLRMKDNHLRLVRNNRGEKVRTSKVFDIYRKWIEDRIAREKRVTFYNTSLDGAAIKGTTVISLAELIDKLPSRNKKIII
ncbi:MAG: DUF115 domain-containing protein [Clostridia bacterium]|nr:DUF115 domain-containing protein [Clostridia bacterium]